MLIQFDYAELVDFAQGCGYKVIENEDSITIINSIGEEILQGTLILEEE